MGQCNTIFESLIDIPAISAFSMLFINMQYDIIAQIIIWLEEWNMLEALSNLSILTIVIIVIFIAPLLTGLKVLIYHFFDIITDRKLFFEYLLFLYLPTIICLPFIEF